MEPSEVSAEITIQAELHLLRGGQPTGTVYTITSPCIIGRYDPNVGPVDVDLASIQEGPYVSRRHAELRYEGGQWILKDLGSSNGTFILSESGCFTRITEETTLKNGDHIAFGNAQFLFRCVCPSEMSLQEEPSQEEPAPEETSLLQESGPDPSAPENEQTP
jgi:pSer/pThr/pTyr-binding forkhead associated (FHA) protein